LRKKIFQDRKKQQETELAKKQKELNEKRDQLRKEAATRTDL